MDNLIKGLFEDMKGGHANHATGVMTPPASVSEGSPSRACRGSEVNPPHATGVAPTPVTPMAWLFNGLFTSPSILRFTPGTLTWRVEAGWK